MVFFVFLLVFWRTLEVTSAARRAHVLGANLARSSFSQAEKLCIREVVGLLVVCLYFAGLCATIWIFLVLLLTFLVIERFLIFSCKFSKSHYFVISFFFCQNSFFWHQMFQLRFYQLSDQNFASFEG